MMLTALKQSTQLFTDGLSLVNEYKAKNGSGISLILMDIAMPGMDGFAVQTIFHDRQQLRSVTSKRVRDCPQ
jgi:CheY-like chemotaxis protein